MRLFVSAALVCCLLLGRPCPARADNITVDGGWQSFSWTNAPGTMNTEGPLSYTSAQQTKLTVTDAFLDGDRFQVFDKDMPLGLTSPATDDGTQIGDKASAALSNPKFSSGSFLLSPGSHSITIKIVGTAVGHSMGTGFLRADTLGAPSHTPEPAGLTLVLAAGACVACYRWRLTSTKSVPRLPLVKDNCVSRS
jgi:hypothetical protein